MPSSTLQYPHRVRPLRTATHPESRPISFSSRNRIQDLLPKSSARGAGLGRCGMITITFAIYPIRNRDVFGREDSSTFHTRMAGGRGRHADLCLPAAVSRWTTIFAFRLDPLKTDRTPDLAPSSRGCYFAHTTPGAVVASLGIPFLLLRGQSGRNGIRDA